MKKLFYLITGFVLCIGLGAVAQDKIYKKGGEVIVAKISEVGTDEIKYKVFKDVDGPVYTIEKARILKVVYQNGRTEVYQSNNMNDPELYADQAKNAVKVNFLSPLLGYTQFNFEHNLKPGRSYELSLGIIGLGKRQVINETYNGNNGSYTADYRNQAGAYVGGGFKFSKMPDYMSGKERYSHVMQGFYAKPEFLFGVYSQDMYMSKRVASGSGYIYSYGISNKTVVFSSLLVNVGKQWVLGDMFLIDLYAGIGYAVDNLHPDTTSDGESYSQDDYFGNHFAVTTTGTDSGLGLGGGIKVGILLNKKKAQ